MKPEGRLRKTKWFSHTNSTYMYADFVEWMTQNPNIDIEHIALAADHYAHKILVTYFEETK